MKISFDTTVDSVAQVLDVIKAAYGVEVTVGGAPEPAQPQEFEPVLAESDSAQEQGSVSEPEDATPAEEPAPSVAEQAAEATIAAERARSRSAAKRTKADGADAGVETKTEPAKKAAAKKSVSKKAPVNRPAAKKAASKKASAPRPRAATTETTAPEPAPGRGKGTRAATKSASTPRAAKPEAKLVRAWAREQGLENVPGRGTLPARIYEQYWAAHA